jgi:hypothetical protein
MPQSFFSRLLLLLLLTIISPCLGLRIECRDYW